MTNTIQLLLVGAAFASIAAQSARAADNMQVRTIKVPRPATAGGHYTFNRAPLQPTAFLKLPPGAITPRGWLRHQLELDANGLVGRMPEISDYLEYEDNGWVDPKSNNGWEELGYWLRGYGDLGYVLKDPRIIATTKKWVDGIMANQKPDGYFGPEKLRTDLWPHMLMLDTLHSYYEYSGDERVIPFMLRYFKWQNEQPVSVFRSGWGALRWADNMAVIYWAYNKTGEAWLLQLADKIHHNSVNYVSNLPNMHNVNLAQGIREPAEYWMQAKDRKYLQGTEDDYQSIMGQYGQFPGGGFAGDENIRPGFDDPRQGFETCGIVEFMHTFEMMTRIAGDPVWADRCEDIAFNSLPAALTPDRKAIHYVTSANLVAANRGGVSDQFDNNFPMLVFKPGIHDYRCCPHNYGMGWPYYAEELWLATADKGLAASLYAASEVTAKVGDGPDGTTVTWTESTDYPFRDTIEMKLATPKNVTFSLYLRIPRWCANATLKINGKTVAAKAEPLSYLAIRREWKNGDTVSLRLPMQIAVRRWEKNKDSVSVNYGPLTFALGIREKWVRDGGTDAWPEHQVLPQSAWNYGLELNARNPAQSFQLRRRPGPIAAQPFTPATAPLSLEVKARQIPAWQADIEGIVTPLQDSPVRSTQPLETVQLIPMGAARLRIASFPVIGDGPQANTWKPLPLPEARLSASHVHDSLAAMLNPTDPQSSSDMRVPRFTWWDHKGGTEWVQLDFLEPRTISAVLVYWYDDIGSGFVRVPQSWRVLVKDGDTWKPAQNPGAYGTALDAFNRVAFDPVKTSGLRIEAKLQDDFSGGILRVRLEPKK